MHACMQASYCCWASPIHLGVSVTHVDTIVIKYEFGVSIVAHRSDPTNFTTLYKYMTITVKTEKFHLASIVSDPTEPATVVNTKTMLSACMYHIYTNLTSSAPLCAMIGSLQVVLKGTPTQEPSSLVTPTNSGRLEHG